MRGRGRTDRALTYARHEKLAIIRAWNNDWLAVKQRPPLFSLPLAALLARASTAILVCATAALLAGCGAERDSAAAAASADARAQALAAAGQGGQRGGGEPIDLPASEAEARRFLSFASFGPNEAQLQDLMRVGYSAWIDAQFTLPATSHRAYWDAQAALLAQTSPGDDPGTNGVLEAWWLQALNGPDQLRLRVAYALSQIFVLSAVDGEVTAQARALAAWQDMLALEVFGNYRSLLENVARHPLMGRYLTHLRNEKANPATGRVPDENFAREVMQLFSIGLVLLNPDGSPVLRDGQPVETYGPDDVTQLARVFTGWSFDCPAFPSNLCFTSGFGSNGAADPDREFKPMRGYPQFHSPEPKTFLGVTIPAQNPADPQASLQLALDTLAAHPNVGPFIGRQLIQRLVMSNPSPAYVAAVSAVWADNGQGVRGDLKAVVKTILLHPEARSPLATPQAGKLREPVLRLAAFLRAFPHTSLSGRWQIGDTDLPGEQLGQTPLRSPSVFNFYRPGYAAPLSQSAAAGMVAPELQLLNETTVAGYVNYLGDGLIRGFGAEVLAEVEGNLVFLPDLQRDWSPELALAATPEALVDHVLARLVYGDPGRGRFRSEVLQAVQATPLPALQPGGANQGAVDQALRQRVRIALLLTLAAPEFGVQP